MKIKIQKKKFIRNILIGIIALFIVAFIINTAPGYKRNKYKDVTNLVIGDENVTETLKKPIYIDEGKNIYIAKEDIEQLLDKTIYYDEENNTIILSSDVSVASMKIGEKVININGANKDTLSTIQLKDNVIYIPLQEIKAVYNLEVNYISKENIVVIDKLNKGMIKAEVEEEATMRFKPRSLSKKVGKIQEGEIVSAFYTTSKGWRLIRTENGNIGYIKANVLTNDYIVRQDMNQNLETNEITTNVSDGTTLNINGKSILIKDLLSMTSEGILIKNVELPNENENIDIWANLEVGDANITNYNERAKVIKNIISIAIKNNIKGINILIKDNNQDLERFVIELSPRLRELGIITNIVSETNIEKDKYTNIVKYIITNR